MPKPEIFDEELQIVGNSPMVAIYYSYRGEEHTVHAKSENFNITGSIRDRMALFILQKAYRTGQIKPGDTIVEATSGNTINPVRAFGRVLGHHDMILMPEWISKDWIEIISSLGHSQHDGQNKRK